LPVLAVLVAGLLPVAAPLGAPAVLLVAALAAVLAVGTVLLLVGRGLVRGVLAGGVLAGRLHLGLGGLVVGLGGLVVRLRPLVLRPVVGLPVGRLGVGLVGGLLLALAGLLGGGRGFGAGDLLLGLALRRRGAAAGPRGLRLGSGSLLAPRRALLLTALLLLDGGDELALAHPGHAGDAEAGRERLELGEHHRRQAGARPTAPGGGG